MDELPGQPADNVVCMPVKLCERQLPARDIPAATERPSLNTAVGGPNDPRVQEAMRLVGAFLAIEDAAAREALVTLADSLVTCDWARNQRRR